MALLLPADFELSSLQPSEQRVVRAFVDGLDDSWVVVPSVPVTVDRNDHEIDVVLASPTRGVVLVEVKGGLVSMRGGEWFQYNRQLKSPVEQVKAAKHALVARLKSIHIELRDLFMVHAVALPDIAEVPPEGFGPGVPADIVFAKPQLEFPADAVANLHREHAPVPPERFATFVRSLRPDVELEGHDGAVLRAVRRHLDEGATTHLANVVGLDRNRRVLVTGGAGTGKTMLVQRWALRAVERGERTLVVCFNKPIAEQLQRSLGDLDVMVGTYHDVAVRLLSPHGFAIGERPTPEYWRDVPTDAMAFHAERIGTPFDTVIVDEGQDFYPHWFESLERLLDPVGARRLLVVADPAQAIYVKPWQQPDDMVVVPLVFNLRNCRSIATVVQRLGGGEPAPLPAAPFGERIEVKEVGGTREMRKRVRDAVVHLTGTLGVPFSQIAVLTTRTDMRTALLADQFDECPLVRWEDRTEEAVLCETVQRTKGLERTAVVLVDMSAEPDRTLLYVGVSRAIASLCLVGTKALTEAVLSTERKGD